jgi:DNA-binding transcriptional MerR regulator
VESGQRTPLAASAAAVVTPGRPGRPERPTQRGRAARDARDAVASHAASEASGELFGITELCAEFGVTPRALRFYEDKGLLEPRRVGGTRVYSRRDRARLALILKSKAIGSTLAEIRHFLELYGAHGEGRVQQLRFVLDRTDAALAELADRRAKLESLIAEIGLINATARRQLEGR